MDLDERAYPLTAGYLRSLPHGLQSFPACKVRSSVFEDIKQDFPELGQRHPLPPIVRNAIDGNCGEEWIAEVVGNALFMVMRDSVLDSDDKFMEWHRGNMRRLYGKPLNRALIYIFSPTLLIMGATKRWNHFHLGSELVAGPVTEADGLMRGTARFVSPENVFNELLLRRLTISFEVALEGSRAREPQVEWQQVSATDSLYNVSWKK
ncbi:MAG: hypothetical protein JXR83_05160 [Deltaproteobacteria bacterium]|nr:hypothetical protein [Deltaproteobacteria bacterium]